MNDIATTEQRPVITSENVERIEANFLRQPQVECSLTHRFAPGICIREVHMPAGSIIIGHKHRFSDMNNLMAGSLTLLNEDGSTTKLKAPYTYLGKPNRKIAIIHEDVVWQNIFPTLETDAEKVEEIFLEKSLSFLEFEEFRFKKCVLEHQPDREDFTLLPPQACLIKSDGDMTTDDMGVVVAPSPIHGRGLFATRPFSAGHAIFKSIEWVNHSRSPNCVFKDGWLVAIRMISGNSGGVTGEELTIDYRSLNEKETICQQ